MKDANQYARAAIGLNSFADMLKPEAGSPYVDIENLIVYHIRVAAKDALRLSQAIAAKEGTDADA